MIGIALPGRGKMIGAAQFACEALSAEGQCDRLSTADGMRRRLLFAGEIRVKKP